MPAVPGSRDADVIVVGAGLAGLVAARQLVAARRDVLVLEARDRGGGGAAQARPWGGGGGIPGRKGGRPPRRPRLALPDPPRPRRKLRKAASRVPADAPWTA